MMNSGAVRWGSGLIDRVHSTNGRDAQGLAGCVELWLSISHVEPNVRAGVLRVF